ncbi:MAG: RNA polymerase sigma factor [Pseudomonadota bacterium]
MDDQVSDFDLVARAVDGDRAGFAALVNRHYDLIFRIAWKWCGNKDDAADIAQDVCVRLGKSIRSWFGEAKFTTWLYRVVLNAAHDFTRKRKREEKNREEYALEPIVDCEGAADESQISDLWTAVRRLSEKQREAVTLVYGEELSHAEAAEAMDCAEATVSYHIHEAKERLKKLMATQTEDVAGEEANEGAS